MAVTVTEVNDAPTANADSATVGEDSTGNVINVLGNDSTGPANESGQTLTVVAASALHGTVTINVDGTLSYAADANYNGTDTISYTIEDNGTTNGAGDPLQSSSSVAVTVTEVNDAPTANADSATVGEDSTGNVINVLGNDSTGPANESGQTLTVVAASAVHGTVTINVDGTLSYAADANYNGTDTISYTIEDNGTTNGAGDPLQSSSSVAVTVTEVNDAPTANADSATVGEDSTGNVINVLGNDSTGPANESAADADGGGGECAARDGDDQRGRHAVVCRGCELQRNGHDQLHDRGQRHDQWRRRPVAVELERGGDGDGSERCAGDRGRRR